MAVFLSAPLTVLSSGFLVLNSIWNSCDICPHKIHCISDIYRGFRTRFELHNWRHLALIKKIFSIENISTKLLWYALVWLHNKNKTQLKTPSLWIFRLWRRVNHPFWHFISCIMQRQISFILCIMFELGFSCWQAISQRVIITC